MLLCNGFSDLFAGKDQNIFVSASSQASYKMGRIPISCVAGIASQKTGGGDNLIGNLDILPAFVGERIIGGVPRADDDQVFLATAALQRFFQIMAQFRAFAVQQQHAAPPIWVAGVERQQGTQ